MNEVNQDDKLRIFISHKFKDKRIAENITNELKIYASGRLEFFFSTPPGEDYRKKIDEELKVSDWLLLLYTDPTAEWDWCMFEVGFFAAKVENSEHRVICLHSEDPDVTPPKPLDRWQSVKANEEEVSKLLKQLYGDPLRHGIAPLNPDLASDPERLKGLARTITEDLGPAPKQPKFFTNYLLLYIGQDQISEIISGEGAKSVPEDVLIESDRLSLAMFGLGPRDDKFKWGEIVNKLSEQAPEQIHWTRGLSILIYKAYKKELFDARLSLFNSPWDNKLYRPRLHRSQHLTNHYLFKIIFTEVDTEEDFMPSGDLGTISRLMIMARMFRWSVLEEYKIKVDAHMSDNQSNADISKTLNDLQSAIDKVLSEAIKYRYTLSDNVIAPFKNETDKNEISKMFKDWERLRKQISDKIKAKDIKKVRTILDGMREMNKNFLILAAKRYFELIKEM